jgi:hypothetical protein
VGTTLQFVRLKCTASGCLVTDCSASPDVLRTLRELGIDVVIAQMMRGVLVFAKLSGQQVHNFDSSY